MTDTTTATSIPNNKTSVNVNTDILPNILDNYEIPTYHFRLYMMSPGAVRARNWGPQSDAERVVIAESGVSTASIDDVNITTTGSITRSAGSGVATNISFTLLEPYGSTILDQIQRAGYYLGIENFQNFPLFLELSFTGRKDGRELGLGGNPIKDFQGREIQGSSASADPLRNQVWTWPIQLLSMAMNITSGGSTYAIEAVHYSDHAYSNQSSDVEAAISIVTDSVGDFFTQLQQELNRREDQKKESSKYVLTDKYEFYIDDELFNAKIVPGSTEERNNRAASYSQDSGKMTFTFKPGISIEKIVKNVLTLTDYFQTKTKATDDPNAIGDDTKGEDAILPVLWRTVADTDIGDYDRSRNDYQRTYKYLIVPYTVPSLQTPASIKSKQGSSSRFNALKRRGLIKKLYNYVYTGMNDQVFDFELNFNFNWYVALPIQGGLTTVASKAEPAAKLTPDQKINTEKLAEGIDNAKSFVSNPIGFAPMSRIEDVLSSFTSGFGPLETAQNAVNDAQNTINSTLEQATAATDAATATVQSGMPSVPDFAPGLIQPPVVPTIINPTAGVLSGPGTLVERLSASAKGPRVSADANVNVTDKAQQNLREIDKQVDDIGETDADNEKISRFLTTIQESKAGKEAVDGQDFAASAGQTLLSALFEQAGSAVAGDLLNIELNIKGDPYWLEPTPQKRTDAPSSQFRRMLANRGFDPDGGGATNTTPQNAEQDEVLVANTAAQETLMVFRSFTPQEFDPDTGITPAGKKSSNVLNGVYAVKMVRHEFTGGEFKQTLEGVRLVDINLRNVDLYENLRDQPEDSASAAESPPATTDLGLNTGVDALDFGVAAIQQGGVDLTQNPLGAWTGVNTSPSGQITPSIFTAPNIAIPSVGSSVRIGTPTTPNTPTTTAPGRRTSSPSRKSVGSASSEQTGTGSFSSARSSEDN